MTLSPGTKVYTPDGAGFVNCRLVDAYHYAVRLEQSLTIKLYNVSQLEPVNRHYSPATATEPPEEDGDYPEEIDF